MQFDFVFEIPPSKDNIVSYKKNIFLIDRRIKIKLWLAED